MASSKVFRKPGLGSWILIGMVAGGLIGWAVGEPIIVLEPLGTILIRLLKMLIIPLVFFSVSAGICSIEKFARVRKIGGLFIGYWVFSGIAASAIGFTIAKIMKPGMGIVLEAKEYVKPEVSLVDSFLGWIPTNPVEAMASFNLVQVLVFTIIFGLGVAALSMSKVEAGTTMKKFLEAGSAITFKMIGWVLWYAPIGVFCLMAVLIGTSGAYVIKSVFSMVATQWIAYSIIFVLFYGLFLRFAVGVNPLQHVRNIYPAMALAFASCSSGATMPVTMQVEKDMGVPEDAVNFLQPVASTINMHAVAAELPIYVVWTSQMFGLSLSPGEIVLIILLGVILAAACAGVPGGGIVVAAIVLTTMGLPLTPIPWIAGVYRLIDMPNTMLNNVGDTVGMAWVAKRIGELDLDKYYRRVRSKASGNRG